jgi:hypothetical protein
MSHATDRYFTHIDRIPNGDGVMEVVTEMKERGLFDGKEPVVALERSSDGETFTATCDEALQLPETTFAAMHDQIEYAASGDPMTPSELERIQRMGFSQVAGRLLHSRAAVPETYKQKAGKPRWSTLLGPCGAALKKVLDVREYGIAKYKTSGNPNSWQLVPSVDYADSAIRHLQAYVSGDKRNPEDGNLYHLAQAAIDCLFALTNDLRGGG